MSSRITVLRILEIFWFILGCIALAGFAYKASSEGVAGNKNYYLLFIGLISLVMFFLRRRKRIFLEKQIKQEQNN